MMVVRVTRNSLRWGLGSGMSMGFNSQLGGELLYILHESEEGVCDQCIGMVRKGKNCGALGYWCRLNSGRDFEDKGCGWDSF